MYEPPITTLVPALIVEDIRVTRVHLEGLLREICGADCDIATVATLAGARAELTASPRPFVLVDIGLPDGNGIELVQWLHRQHPLATSLVVSAWGDEETVLTALRAGATGYLFKERDSDELRAALRSVQRGGAPIDPFVARHILAALASAADARDALSARETEILRLAGQGCSNREIAEATQLTPLAVEICTRAIYRKLAGWSRTPAVHEAPARGLRD